MHLLDLTLDTPAANIALDEALLLTSEGGDPHDEWLRLWEPAAPLVVLGRSSRVSAEVNTEACHDDAIPILRRCSGGAAIVSAPGCLMYAVVLSHARRPELRAIDRAHEFVLSAIQAALAPHAPGLQRAGTSDLALAGRKVSGNSLRCLRTHLLYHGTLLYHMRPELVERYLRTPPRQPSYRQNRSHVDFVGMLPVSRELLRSAITEAFDGQTSPTWPSELTAALVAEKYSREEWTRNLG